MDRSSAEHSDWSEKAVFSTGEAAQVCSVSQQTIIRCFDSGRLQGFRVPGSKFRRIPRAELIRFMRENDIPVSRLESSRQTVLCLATSSSALLDLADAGLERLDIEIVHNGFDAGWIARDRTPRVVIFDAFGDACVRRAMIDRFSAFQGRRPLLLMLGDGSERVPGVDHVVARDASADEIGEKIIGLLDAEDGQLDG